MVEIWSSRLGFGPQGWDLCLEARIGGCRRRRTRRNFPKCGKAEVIDSFGAAVQKAQILVAKTSNDVSTVMSADKQFNASYWKTAI